MYIRNKPYRPRYPHTAPRFLAKPSKREEAQWRTTVYYWWWRCLRASESYKRCCERNGRGLGGRVYKHFGDVFATDFRTWWLDGNRGERLFALPAAPEHLHELASAAEWNTEWTRDYVMVIAVPMFESKRRLQSKFAILLKHRHAGKPGHQTRPIKAATFTANPKFNAVSLKKIIELYELRQQHVDWGLADLGEGYNLMPNNMPSADDTKYERYAKRNVMADTVRRHLRKADALMVNVLQGKFPCFD